MQGAHQVAQMLTKRYLSVLLATREASSVWSIVDSSTGSADHFLMDLAALARLVIHFVEQPKGRVTWTGTSLSANKASIAFFASWLVGVLTSESSMRPLYCSFLCWSKINTCGVARTPYAKDTFWFSPSYRYGYLYPASLARTFISASVSPRSE